MPTVSGGTHALFSTGCTPYFDWQSIGLAYSARSAQMDLTRLMSTCADEEARLRSGSLPLMRTFEHPDYAESRVSGVNDDYAPYNKPAGIVHWLQEQHRSRIASDASSSSGSSSSEFVLLLEADMLLRGPIDCQALGVRPGVAVSARYEYLAGATSALARTFIKNAHLVQPIGGWACLHRDDLSRLAPLWLQLTKAVRLNPGKYWHLPGDPRSVSVDLPTGDAYAKRGQPPFVADMLGYAFAAAEVGLIHLERPEVMAYAGQAPPLALPPPKLLHYGMWCRIISPRLPTPWRFNKLSFAGGHKGGFDPHTCGEYLPPPPLPSELVMAQLERAELGAALLCAEVGVRLNAALCEYHHIALPPLEEEEGAGGAHHGAAAVGTKHEEPQRHSRRRVSSSRRHQPVPPCIAAGLTSPEDALCPRPTLEELLDAVRDSDAIGTPEGCDDADVRCAGWADAGECFVNSLVVRPLCPKSCEELRCVKRKRTAPQQQDQRLQQERQHGVAASSGEARARPAMQPEELTTTTTDAQDNAWRAQGMAVGSARSMRAAMGESLRLSEQREPIEEITADADYDLLGIGVANEGMLGFGVAKEGMLGFGVAEGRDGEIEREIEREIGGGDVDGDGRGGAQSRHGHLSMAAEEAGEPRGSSGRVRHGEPRGSVVSRSAQMIVQRSEPIDVVESEADVDKPGVAVAPEVAQDEIQAREPGVNRGVGEAHNGGDAIIIDAALLTVEAPTDGGIEPVPVTTPVQEPNVSELRVADELADELASDVVCLIAAVVLGLLLVGCALKEAGQCFGATWRSLRGSMSDKCRTL